MNAARAEWIGIVDIYYLNSPSNKYIPLFYNFLIFYVVLLPILFTYFCCYIHIYMRS